jgi:hypothetical protein
MDADDICYPERLKAQIDFLQANPEVDLVASKALVFRGTGEILGVMAPPVVHDVIVAHPYNGFVFPHPTWCGKAAWFRKHRYDETMPIAQDQELLLRTSRHSRFASVDRILLGYRKDGIDLSKSARGRALLSRALWRQAAQAGGKSRAVMQIVRQIAIFVADAAAIGVRAEEWLLKRKVVTQLASGERAQWDALWREVSASSVASSQIQTWN